MLLTSWQNVGRNQLVLARFVGILVGPAHPSQSKNSGFSWNKYLWDLLKMFPLRSPKYAWLYSVLQQWRQRKGSQFFQSPVNYRFALLCFLGVCIALELFFLSVSWNPLQLLLFSRTRNLGHSLFETVILSGEPMGWQWKLLHHLLLCCS